MLSWLSPRRIYFRFSQTHVQATCPATGREFSESALVALQVEGKKRTVIAVGNDVPSTEAEGKKLHVPGVVVVRPFQHDRIVVADAEVADAVVRFALLKLGVKGPRRPEIVMH